MCRLFALISNKDASVEFSDLMIDFRALSKDHPHGWGMGWYDGTIPDLIKSPLSANQDNMFLNTSLNVRSKILMAHIRFGTMGPRTVNNTHPFCFDNWMFAHNGTIYSKDIIRYSMPKEYLGRIKGTTDSEYLFHLILFQADEKKDLIKGIRSAIDILSDDGEEKTTSFNFVMSDGKKLYACHKTLNELGTYTLYTLERDKSYDHPATSMIISSSPLTREDWSPIENNRYIGNRALWKSEGRQGPYDMSASGREQGYIKTVS